MKQAPSYPLPSGELGSDDIVCQLVYLPDRPEYWQAFYAALHYMTTWRAWERDGDKRGKDAAANWQAAFELTSGCWRMTCLEQLQDDVAAILAIMQNGSSCCDDQDITDGDRYTDRVEDGEGNVPQNIIDAGYADDAADWDGFDDYKCMIAHVIVNQLPAKISEYVDIADGAGGYLGGVVAVAGIAAVIFGTGGLAIVFGIVAGIGATALLYQSLTDFPLLEDLGDKVVDNHEALACAVYFSDGDAQSLSNLNDKIDELFTAPEALILKSMNIGPTLKALYAGRYDQQDIAAELESAGYDVESFDCSCDSVGEYQYTFDFEDETWQNWSNHSGVLADDAGRDPSWGVYFLYSGGYMHHTHNTLRYMLDGEIGGPGDYLIVHSVSLWYECLQSNDIKPALTIEHTLGTSLTEFDNSRDAWSKGEVHFDPPLIIAFDDSDVNAVKLEVNYGSIGFIRMDDIRFDITTFTA